jgi:hypothetical protein
MPTVRKKAKKENMAHAAGSASEREELESMRRKGEEAARQIRQDLT